MPESLGLVLTIAILLWAFYQFGMTYVNKNQTKGDVWRTIERHDRARDKSMDEPRAKRTMDE